MMTSSVLAQRIEFEEYDLPNGLHVILHQDPSTPIVNIAVSYRVGSKDDAAERTGFAHFFEHLLFEGSENIKRGEYSAYVEENGGILNANTSLDRTFYYETLPSNQLALGLWLESERMLHAKIDEVGVETQREVVKEEKRQRMGSPYGKIFDAVLSNLYEEHPYKNGILGSMDHLNAASIDEFRNFYKKFYVPNNAVLVVAGDFEVAETKKLIDTYFGTIPKGASIEEVNHREARITKQKEATVYDDNISLPAVVLSYRTPDMTTKEAYIVDMISSILSSGKSSRFYRNIVEKERAALQASGFQIRGEDYGTTLLFSIGNVGVPTDRLVELMDKEIELLKTELVSDKEFEKTRNTLESGFIFSKAKLAGIAEALADYYLYYGNTNLINDEIDIYKKFSKEDIRDVMNKYFDPENRLVLYYLPPQR